MIPEDALRCIWMDAGVVDYKLCDRELQCEKCPFDEEVKTRRGGGSSLGSRVHAQSTADGERPSRGNDATVEQLFHRWIAPLTASVYPDDRMYQSNHTWIQVQNRRRVRVGIDHCAAQLLGSMSSVVYPPIPFHTDVREPCVWLVHGEGTMTITAPLSGTITRVNETLHSRPTSVVSSPYEDGWLFTMTRKRDRLPATLMNAGQMPELEKDHLEKLQSEFRRLCLSHETAVGPTLLEAGFPVERVSDAVGPKAFCELMRILFQPG